MFLIAISYIKSWTFLLVTLWQVILFFVLYEWANRWIWPWFNSYEDANGMDNFHDNASGEYRDVEVHAV